MKLPFKTIKDAPQEITVSTIRKVRFNEVDPMGIVWHGCYASYFDDARKQLGDRYGFSYKSLMQEGVKTPIKHFFADYILPLTFDESFEVFATLYWSDAVRLNLSYEVYNSEKQLATKGYSVQLFMDSNNELCFEFPDSVKTFREKWKKGLINV